MDASLDPAGERDIGGVLMPDVFLSYSRRNAKFVRRLHRDLTEHGIDVWLDTDELQLGDSTHVKIEQAISDSRFFCFAISEDSLKSYYARNVELEQAFLRLIAEQREHYILPIVVGYHSQPIPPRIGHLYRIDFTKSWQYANNVRQMVKRIRGIDSDYSGVRWFKGLDISRIGLPVGVGPIAQKATLGPSYRMEWVDGTVVRVDQFQSGVLLHYKEFEFDRVGRVVANKMYTQASTGQWLILDDIWYYSYDSSTGARATKTMRFLGEATARVVHYDRDGRALREEIVTDPGRTQDRIFPYARKVFLYDRDGNPRGEEWYSNDGSQISVAS